MSKTRRINILRYGFILIMALCMSSVFVSANFSPKTAGATSGVTTIKIGDVIKAENYQISHAGGTVTAETMTIVYPSGGVFGGDSFEVKQAGNYQVTYHATVGEQKVEQTEKYLAVRRPQDIIVGEEGMEIGFGKYEIDNLPSGYKINKTVYGAIVNFKMGQSITFGTTIKTEKLTKDYNLLDLIVIPSVFGETDFEKLTMRIADVDNPENYVDVIVLSSNVVDGDGQVSYVKAGANGQQPGGYEGSTYHFGNIYGTQVEHSFRGLGCKNHDRSNVVVSEGRLTLSIDNQEKRVYCGPKNCDSIEQNMVNDLDDPAHFKGNPWGGFLAEEVTVTIYAGEFTKAQGTVLFNKFGDVDLSKDIVDETAPELKFSYDWSEKTPVAIVGQDFPLFDFTAKDALDKNLKTAVDVYYLDGKGNKITIPNDGKTFYAKYEGEYNIIYRAEDYSGNVNTQLVKVQAVEKAPNIFISIEDKFVSVENRRCEEEIYQTVTIPRAEEMKVYGGSGKLSVERTVYAPDKSILDVDDKLTLSNLGDYKIVYTVTDYLGNVEYGVITIRAKEIEKPKFVTEPDFASLFISGFVYELPQPLVVETVNGEVRTVDCEVYVNDVLTDGSFTASGQEMVIRYLAKGTSGESSWEIQVPVEDTEKGKYKSKYFYTESGVTITDEKASVDLSFSSDGEVEFVNPLSSKNLSVVFSYVNTNLNLSTINVTLVDGMNKDVAVTITLFYDSTNDSWFMLSNDKKQKISYGISFAEDKNRISLLYSPTTKMIVDASGEGIDTFKLCDNGLPFEGFSKSVILKVSFGGVTGQSLLSVDKICNQSMGYQKSSIDKAKDEIVPLIELNGEFKNLQKLGSNVYIPTAEAFDVLGQIAEFTITLTDEDDKVLAVVSAHEQINYVLSKAGIYTVKYYAQDTNGKDKEIPYVIFVNDETAPKLKVRGSLKEKYELGSQIKIPKYSAKDNGENCYIQVTLTLPNNEMRLLHYSENGEVTSLLSSGNTLYESAFKGDDDNKFIAYKKGKYVLRIVAYDEYYNYTEKEFEFIVE